MPVEDPGTVKVASLLLGTLAFFGLMVYIGIYTKNWIDSASDFIVSGREVNYLIIAAAFAAIGLAGSMVSAVPEFAIAWGVFPAAMYLLAWCAMVIVFGWFIAPIIRRTGVYTTSEWMEQRFDRRTRIVAAIGSALGIIGVVSAQFVGIGVILAEMTDLPYVITSLAILLVTLAYMYLGGLWAVTVNDVVQIVFGAVAMVAITAWLVITFGSPSWLASETPAMVEVWGTGVVEPISLTFNSPFTWFFGWGALIIGNQYYWIRLVSARSERGAKRGSVLGGILTAIFFTVLLALPGAYALAAYGPPGEAGYAAGGVFGLLILEMPPVMDAFVLVAIIAALMSTASTAIIGIVSILIRDVYEPLVGKASTSDELMGPSRLFTIGVGVLAWLWAVSWEESAGLMLALGWSFLGPLVSVILLGLVWRRLTSTGAFLGITAGIVAVIVWQYVPVEQFTALEAPLGAYAHETWVSLIVPAIVSIGVSLVTDPPYYGRKHWTPPQRERSDNGPGGDTSSEPSTDLQEIAVNLAKPWTLSERWNSYVLRRGRENKSFFLTLLRVNRGESDE